MSVKSFSQISRFLLVGTLVTLVDSIFYTISLILNLPIPVSKALSFLGAVGVGFVLHSRWTFAVKKTSLNQLILFFLLYLVNLGINVVSNSFFLDLVGYSLFGFIFSFLAATTLCAITNFMGQKYIVFKEHVEKPVLPNSSAHHS